MKHLIIVLSFVLANNIYADPLSYDACIGEAWDAGTEYGWDDYSTWYFTNQYANSCDRGLADGLYG